MLQTLKVKLPVELVDAKYKRSLMILPVILALAFLISSSCSSLESIPVKEPEYTELPNANRR